MGTITHSLSSYKKTTCTCPTNIHSDLLSLITVIMQNQISLQNTRSTHPETFLTIIPPDPYSLLNQEITNSTTTFINKTLPAPTGIQRLKTQKILTEKRQQREKAQLENHQSHKLLQHVARSELTRIKKFCELNPDIINIVDPITNQTPLHRCAVENNDKMM